MAQRLQQDARAVLPVTKHGSRWRARVQVAQTQVNGPTRRSKAAAEGDATQLQAALQISAKELQSVAQGLQQEAVDVVARCRKD